MDTFKNESVGPKKVTIVDIAEALDVSKTTVSRAISGKGRISEATRKRVFEYIEASGYKPNVVAKGLAQNKTYNLALVIPGDCNLVEMPFFQNSMQGVCEEASKSDYDVMIATITEGDYSNLERMVDNRKIDGVILSRSFVKDGTTDYLKTQEIPFVLMGTSKDEDILQVDNDHLSACSELVGNLIKKGNKKIGLIGGNQNYVVNRTRLQGYREGLKANKLDIKDELVYMDCDTTTKIDKAVKKLISYDVGCIVCTDDMICLSVLDILEQERREVPSQMKVASFYDSTLLTHREPAITSLLFDDKALGALTCKILLSYIQGEEVKGKNLLGYEVAYRKSTS